MFDQQIREYIRLDERSPSGISWRVKPSRPIPVGASALAYVRPDGYMAGKFKGKYLYAHRVAFFLAYGYWAEEVDHKDGDRANNAPDNLRDADHSGNMQNTKARGYSFDKAINKYRARIYLNNKEIILGNFGTEEEARSAYLESKATLHPFATERCFKEEE